MTGLAPSTIRGFAAVYALLALLTIGSGLGAYAAYTSHGTASKVAHVQAELGNQNLGRVAEKYIAQSAQAQGFAVKAIKILSTKVTGDDAVVIARIAVTDGQTDQTLRVRVTISRGVWVVDGMAAA